MTSATLCNGELRVYNRRNAVHSVVQTDKKEKDMLKKLGFVWDNRNHSYRLDNASTEAVNFIQSKVHIQKY
jgi:hypothetical protein